MNTGQIKKYRCHVRDWKLAREARGLPADDEMRYALHKRVTGRACSSTAFTQKEFDDVLGALLAESRPADFNAQMRQQEQPEERRKAMIGRCWKAMRSFLDFTSENQFQRAAEGYANATAKRIHGVGLDHLSENQLAVVMGALERSAAVKAKQREHAETAAQAGGYAEEEDPFA